MTEETENTENTEETPAAPESEETPVEAPAALVVRLLGARDRLARSRLLADDLRPRAARGAGHVPL